MFYSSAYKYTPYKNIHLVKRGMRCCKFAATSSQKEVNMVKIEKTIGAITYEKTLTYDVDGNLETVSVWSEV